jgi:superfamily II DNA or RNA helicase
MSLSKEFRYYQVKADDAIYEELLINNKCIVKMFCGTGKSLLMRKCKTAQNQNLLVYVFPSLSLIDQFCADYFTKKDCPFKISSESESTTDPAQIIKFLKKKTNKIICVTYQSYKTLLDNLGSTKINVCIYDEAHHAVGETYQKLIFEQESESESSVVKQIFFTATPKNANGIIMYDRNNLNAGMCGKMVYDYSYLTGMNEEYLNPFEIRVDMYTANTNNSIYESIARAILISGNNRVLTFHADVNTDRDTSVLNFVNEAEFVNAFCKVLMEEFPEKASLYTKFKMIALDASIKMDQRRKILDNFDTTPDNEVYIISSCETIGEGIDTKKANMCVFADPKSSFVKIIQNIGRIVRKQSKISTILIPCWVDKEKYIGCDEDREKCDEVIRSDLNKDGNFNGILNVLSALRQEDEDLYEACLYYGEEVDDNTNNICASREDSSSESDSDSDSDSYSDIDSDSEYDEEDDDELPIKPKFKINVTFHTNDEIKVLWKISSDIDIMKNMCSCVLDCEVEKYDQMEVAVALVGRAKDRERNGLNLLPRHIQNKQNRTIPELEQENKDSTKLGGWKKALKGQGRGRCSNEVRYYLDDNLPEWRTEIDFDEKSMEDAKHIVERAFEREKKGFNLFPRAIREKKNRTTLELEQENKDASKLGCWKHALKNSHSRWKCCKEVCDYLDKNLFSWRTEIDLNKKAMEDAKKIVERAKEREKNGFKLLPQYIPNKTNRHTTELEEESKDASKLGRWKQALKGKGSSNCSDEVLNYLDETLPDWRSDYGEKAMLDAIYIVERAKERVKNGGKLLPSSTYKKENRKTNELQQQHKDATKLGNWKTALKEKGTSKCPNEVLTFLDEKLPDWRTKTDFNEQSMEDAKNIVKRAKERVKNSYNLLPRHIIKKENRTTPELEEENKDANKLGSWKRTLNGKGSGICSKDVSDYLDENLPDWKTTIDLDEKAIDDAVSIVERANERVKNDGKLLPRNITKKENRTTPELEEENKDANKLGMWKKALKGKGSWKCSNEVRDYLDENLPGWRVNDDDNTKSSSSSSSDVIEEEEEIIITPKKKKSMKLTKPSIKKETCEQRRERAKSELSVLHQRYKTMKSENLKNEFQETPELWHQYHAISEENEKSFPEESIPRNCIIQELVKIKTNRTKKVVDMGCGKAQIADHFANDNRFSFINYDHVSSKENIEVQDISKIPLGENDVEICILCLAMWGSNCEDYIKEAYRILESGGNLYIIEATKRWSEKDENGIVIAGQEGNKLKKLLEENGFKIVCEKIEKFSYFKCTK